MIKAIPTVYAGVQMRSRLEARFAECLDKMDIKWLYEAEGYDLDGTWYLPDFFLPELDIFAEVKGVMGGQDRRKIELLVVNSRKSCLIVYPFNTYEDLRHRRPGPFEFVEAFGQGTIRTRGIPDALFDVLFCVRVATAKERRLFGRRLVRLVPA